MDHPNFEKLFRLFYLSLVFAWPISSFEKDVEIDYIISCSLPSQLFASIAIRIILGVMYMQDTMSFDFWCCSFNVQLKCVGIVFLAFER